VRGAAEGQGLGNAFLSHIHEVDGIFHVVRVFEDPDVTHVEDTVDPLRDLQIITEELIKKDIAAVEAVLVKVYIYHYSIKIYQNHQH
jgi:obg-like ATPase 1